MTQYGFHFNARRCTGCKTCMLACKDYRNLPSTISFRQVYEYAGGSWLQDGRGLWTQDCFAYYVSVACNHCSDPACVKVCPTGAMHKGDGGLVSVDHKKCIGCGYCALSCPYRAPKVDREQGFSAKCDGCESRVSEGREPVCVEACPLRALEFGDISDIRDRCGQLADLAPLPPFEATHPNLVITPPANASRADEGAIENAREIV